MLFNHNTHTIPGLKVRCPLMGKMKPGNMLNVIFPGYLYFTGYFVKLRDLLLTTLLWAIQDSNL